MSHIRIGPYEYHLGPDDSLRPGQRLTLARTLVLNEPTSLTLTSDCRSAEHSSFSSASIAYEQCNKFPEVGDEKVSDQVYQT